MNKNSDLSEELVSSKKEENSNKTAFFLLGSTTVLVFHTVSSTQDLIDTYQGDFKPSFYLTSSIYITSMICGVYLSFRPSVEYTRPGLTLCLTLTALLSLLIPIFTLFLGSLLGFVLNCICFFIAGSISAFMIQFVMSMADMKSSHTVAVANSGVGFSGIFPSGLKLLIIGSGLVSDPLKVNLAVYSVVFIYAFINILIFRYNLYDASIHAKITKLSKSAPTNFFSSMKLFCQAVPDYLCLQFSNMCSTLIIYPPVYFLIPL